MKRIIRNDSLIGTILLSSITNFSVMMLTMIHSIIIARMLGVEGRGELAVIVFWPVFLSGLVGLGLPTSLIYNVKQNKSNNKVSAFVKVIFIYLIPISLITGIVAWFCLPIWLENYSLTAIQLAQMYTLFSIPLTLSTNILSALAKSFDKFHISNGLLLSVPLLNAISLIVLGLSGYLNLITATISYLIPSILAVIAGGIVLKRQISKSHLYKLPINAESTKQLFRYGVKVYGLDLMSTIYTQADKLIIVSLLTPRDLGLYSVVFALSRVFNTVQLAITDVLFPKVTGLEREEILSIVGKSFRISMMLMVTLLIPSLFIGRFLLGILFGKEFLEASTTFYILSLECIIGGGSWILASSFNAIGRPELVLIRQAIAIAINVVLFFIFTPLLGLEGLALALLSGAVVRLIITLVQIPHAFNVPLRCILYDHADFAYLKNILKEKRIRKGRMVS
ncbi:lipopolysaccharide biosynthesis protein [Paenibacillus gallinarum]|nr:oligosaccharide flippase family protein [Paenibacillus gallinarum]